jgi:hypothetical protein
MSKTYPPPQWDWIALIFGLLMLGQFTHYLPDLKSSPWLLIEDDGRHFVAWLRKLADPALFPNDPVERFFSGVTPALYKAFYFPAIWTGVDVVRWHILAVIPASILLFLWSADRFTAVFVSEPAQRAVVLLCLAAKYFGLYGVGLPRSFGLATVLLVISTFAAGKRWQLATIMMLGTNMYPASAVTAGGGLAFAEVLRLATVRRIDTKILSTLVIAAFSGAVGLAIFLASAADLGPTITLAEARELPIFQPFSRASYFDSSPFFQLSCGDRARLLPICGPGDFWWFGYPATLLVLIGGICMLYQLKDGTWRLLAGLCLSGVILFTIATIVAFKAHLPSRYSNSSIGVVFDFVFFVTIATWLAALARRSCLPALTAPIVVLLLLATLKYDQLSHLTSMKRDNYTKLSASLRLLPKDTMVAGTTPYLDGVPSFAGRSVYAAIELAVPYKRDYYREIEHRAAKLAILYGSTDRTAWRAAHAETGIDVYVVDTDGVEDTAWARSFPIAPQAGSHTIFAAEAAATEQCTIASQRDLALVDAACFVKALGE